MENGVRREYESIFTIEKDILTIENKPENSMIITKYKRI